MQTTLGQRRGRKASVQQFFFYFRDYRADWLKMKEEKLAESKKNEEEMNTADSSDTVLDKKRLIEEVVRGREMRDMYLKHPGNESSSDDEGTEQTPEVG